MSKKMDEGVSLSFPRNGLLSDNHLVVSVPFSRDLCLNGGFILQDLQAGEGDSFCENKLSGCLSCPSLNDAATLKHQKADGLRESISAARHVLPISIRQDLSWLGEAVFARTSCGDKVRPKTGPFRAGKGTVDTRSGHRSSYPTSSKPDLFICGDRPISSTLGIGIALNAEVISDTAGAVTDVPDNAINTDLGAISDLQRTATLSIVLDRSERDV